MAENTETKKKAKTATTEDSLDLGATKKKKAKKATAKATAEKDEVVVKKDKTEPKSEKAEKTEAPAKKKTKKAAKKSDEGDEDEAPKTEAPKSEAPKKKKVAKKASKKSDEADEAEAPTETKVEAEETAASEPGEAEANDAEEGNEDNEFGTKKKKKKETLASESLPEDDYTKSDRDYQYGELLSRVFAMLAENNPELLKSKKKQILIKPPEVLRVGTKKTVWANYQEICSMMHRPSDHVLAYTCTELGTTASIDGNQRLVINGRFQPKQIESIVRRYVADYVSCGTCKSPDTVLKKENRLFFIKCKACGSTRSVQAIKQGFVAQIGKRKK